MTNSVHLAAKHVADILTLAIKHDPKHAALVVFDEQCQLATTLTNAYRQCLPTAKFINFDTTTHANILANFELLKAGDLVVLIQSSSFRLGVFRIRIELFNQSLKVIEHPHLGRMIGPEQDYYIDALAYDAHYYHHTGNALKNLIDQSNKGIVDSGGEQLIFDSPFESAKLNIGDYTGMKNIGGQFPIGEVFTEAEVLEAVNGRVRIFAFGDTSFSVNRPPQPITLVIEKGRVVNTVNSTPAFELVLANIRADEDEVWLRELGFGMNRAFSQDRTVTDIGTYERMCGVHLSLGAKHNVYKKSNFKRSNVWHHVDVFAVTQAVYLDDKVIYKEGTWQV